MKSKEEIISTLESEVAIYNDKSYPMDEMQWANNQGWIEALEYVLDEEKKEPKDITRILEGANNDTITRAIKRLSEECGFGRKDHAFDREDDSICDGLLYGPNECTT